MTEMPDDWSVEVHGRRVVLRVSGRPDDEHYLSIQQAQALKNEMHLASVIAERNQDSSVDVGAPLRAAGPLRPSQVPEGWSIAARGLSVALVLPASAGGSDFTLRVEEAVAVALALIQQAERARSDRQAARHRIIEEARGSLGRVYGADHLGTEHEGWTE